MIGAQNTGDCVSWGTSSAVDISRCCEIRKGKAFSYKKKQATALIYASRGHSGQGMSGAGAARSVYEDGILLELKYLNGKYDFTDYQEYWELGTKWGRRGAPEDLKTVTRKNKVKTISLLNSMEEVRDALANGYAVACCSDIGVSSAGSPISRLKGSWSHCMAIIGCDDRKKHSKETLYIWDQSWGKWKKVTNWPKEYGPKPEGVFILTESDTWKAVRARGSWVFSDTKGFPARPLDFKAAIGA